MKKTVTKKWKENVEEAKKLLAALRLTTQHRMRVAEIAINSCKMFYGGRVDEHVVTRKKFAGLIGMNNNTLYEWIKIYETTYSLLSPTQKADADRRWICVVETRKRMKGVKNPSPKKVQAAFQKEIMLNGAAVRFNKYLAHANAILYNAENPRKLVEVPTETLEKMRDKCAKIVGNLNEEIRFREKHGTSFDDQRYVEVQPDVKDFWEKQIGVSDKASL